MMGRQPIGEGMMGGTTGAFHIILKGRFPCSAWYVSTSNLYWHLLVAGSQCNSRNIPEICSCLIVPQMRRAAALCAICSFFIVPTARQLYKLLQ